MIRINRKGATGNWLLLALMTILLVQITAKETRIVQAVAEDKLAQLFILREINQFLVTDFELMGRWYNCIESLETLSQSNKETPTIIISKGFNKEQINTLKKKHSADSGSLTEDQSFRLRVDRILSMLHGLCAKHHTKFFIWEYCHQHHIRQFDDEATSSFKNVYEDILLGVYDHNDYQWIHKTFGPMGANHIPYLPSETTFFNAEAAKKIHPLGDSLNSEIDSEDHLIRLSAPLFLHRPYVKQSALVLEAICTTKTSRKTNYVLSLSPYDFVFMNNDYECDSLVSIAKEVYDRSLQYPVKGSNELRIFKNYLYGPIEEKCKARSGQKMYVEQGVTLMFQFQNLDQNDQTVTWLSLRTVEKIISKGVIRLNLVKEEGISFPAKEYYYKQSSEVDLISILSCRIVTDQVIEKTELPFDYAYKNILRVEQREEAAEQSEETGQLTRNGQYTGHNYYCICTKGNMSDFDVTLGYRITKTLYEAVYSYDNAENDTQETMRNCKPTCFEVITKNYTNNTKRNTQQDSKFTKIVKLTNKNPKHIVENEFEAVYVVSIPKRSIVRLEAIDEASNQSCFYYLSRKQVVRIQTLPDGQKKVTKSNKFYENITDISRLWVSQSLHIHVAKMPDGALVGGIWKLNDYTLFPRMSIVGQKLVGFEVVEGEAIIRRLRLDRMKKQEEAPFKDFIPEMQRFYGAQTGMNKEKASPKESLLLNQSYWVKYEYLHGDYCAYPINKRRSTQVILSCGDSWLQLAEVEEASPCNYTLQVKTRLLCSFTHTQVLPPQLTLKEVLCYPKSQFSTHLLRPFQSTARAIKMQ